MENIYIVKGEHISPRLFLSKMKAKHSLANLWNWYIEVIDWVISGRIDKIKQNEENIYIETPLSPKTPINLLSKSW